MSSAGSSEVDPIREVRRVHLALEDWLGGIRDDPGPIERGLAPGFVAIDGDGRLTEGGAWLSDLEARYRTGARVGIDVSNLEHRRSLYGLHLVTYAKQLVCDEELEHLIGSVWLRETQRSGTGLHWLHLQETPTTPPEAVDGEGGG